VIESPYSVRDPSGVLVPILGRMFRLVRSEGVANAEAFLGSRTVARWRAEGRMIRTQIVPQADWPAVAGANAAAMVLEHDVIPFPSYPCEWTPGMLASAGRLTLELAGGLLTEGLGLKDATPLNVLFRGSQPVFVDALSIEPRAPGDPVWLQYGQFVRTFVLPLVAARNLGWSLRRTFTGARDGLAPDELYDALPWRGRFRAPTFGMVTGPVLLNRFVHGRVQTAMPRSVEPDRARYILDHLLGHLGRALAHAAPAPRDSAWTAYHDPCIHAPEYHSAKLRVVEQVLREERPGSVLDVGTNDGSVAMLAASLGASVVAIDRDEAAVERAWQLAASRQARILPLVVDLVDPTPGTGWRNEERLPFLARAAGGFDAVLCLAVLHHLVVGERLALGSVMDLVASLVRSVLVAEFVPPEDPWCQLLTQGRPLPAERWSTAVFEAEAGRAFRIEARHPVGASGRVLYVLRRRPGEPRPR
jgi:SAM-dependent methyltransferase